VNQAPAEADFQTKAAENGDRFKVCADNKDIFHFNQGRF
jgi:hypothetical protein